MRRRKTFEEWYIPVTESGCWLWLGELRPNGYGTMWLYGVAAYRYMYAHRYSYELHNGSIPEGLQIDHLCRVRCCVNPLHLEAVDCRTNVLRGVGSPAINAAKTHCGHGHEFTDANTYWIPGRKNNNRSCRECRRRLKSESNARRRIKQMRAAILAFVLCFTVSTSHAAEVTLDYGEFKNMVQQCHTCRKAVAAYKEKDVAQASVIDSQKTYIETLEEGQRIQGALNDAYEAKLKEGEQLSWMERGAWFTAGVAVALITKRFVPAWRGK